MWPGEACSGQLSQQIRAFQDSYVRTQGFVEVAYIVFKTGSTSRCAIWCMQDIWGSRKKHSTYAFGTLKLFLKNPIIIKFVYLPQWNADRNKLDKLFLNGLDCSVMFTQGELKFWYLTE